MQQQACPHVGASLGPESSVTFSVGRWGPGAELGGQVAHPHPRSPRARTETDKNLRAWRRVNRAPGGCEPELPTWMAALVTHWVLAVTLEDWASVLRIRGSRFKEPR